MFVLDLFNTPYERALNEGAVDDLEARHIHGLNTKMLDLMARAKDAKPEMKAALKREYDKIKAERDEFYKIRNETMGYGSLVGEAGIGQDIVNRTEKMARATPSTPASKVSSTVKNAAKWLAGKGGPGREGPTYEGQDQKKNSEKVEEAGTRAGALNTAQQLYKAIQSSKGKPQHEIDLLQRQLNALARKYQLKPEEYTAGANQQQAGSQQQPPPPPPPPPPGGQQAGGQQNANQSQQGNWWQQQYEKHYGQAAQQSQQANPDNIWNPHWAAKQQAAYRQAGGKGIDPNWAAKNIQAGQQMGAANQAAMNASFQSMNAAGPWNMPGAKMAAEEEVEEGWSDAVVAQRTGRPRTPYSVYIKGKKWRDFENDDHAEAVANKLRAKFKAEGRDPSVITIAPTDYDKDIKEAGFGEFPPKQEITIVPPKKLKSGETYQDRNKYWQSQGQAPIYKTNEDEEDDDWYDKEESELQNGSYVVDTQDPSGEVYRVSQYEPGARRCWIGDRDGRGWYISPDRLEIVDDQSRIRNYFGKRVEEGDIGQLEKAVADAPVKPIANMEESFESKIQLQGITDQKLLEAARKIDAFSRSHK